MLWNRKLLLDLRDAALVSVAWTIIYSTFLSINWDANSLATAIGIETGAPPSANHMFFEGLGLIVFRIAQNLGYSGQAYPLLEILAAVCGGVTLGVTFLTARAMEASRLASFAVTIWLGSTWALWAWSTNGAYITSAAMCAAIAVALHWNAASRWRQIAAGVMAALAVVAWQANVSLLPALIAGTFLQRSTRSELYKRLLILITSFGATLSAVYISAAGSQGVRSVEGFLRWATSYGGGRLASWGHWGSDRLSVLGETWIHSIVGWVSLLPQWFLSRPLKFNTVFPRLAPWSLVVIVAVPLALFLWRPKDRTALWCLIGAASYIPFLIWWDPYETKWLLTANMFIALFAARLWSRNRAALGRWSYSPLVAAVALFGSQLALYGVPAHTKLQRNNQIGDCVGMHLQSKDLFIAGDWAFGGYMQYRYRVEVIDLIGAVVGSHFDKPAAFKDLLATARARQESGAAVYMTDISFYSPEQLQFLFSTVGVTRPELDVFQGKVAFECDGWRIMKLDPIGDLPQSR